MEIKDISINSVGEGLNASKEIISDVVNLEYNLFTSKVIFGKIVGIVLVPVSALITAALPAATF